MTRVGVRSAMPGRRTVSRGSSTSTVPMPTITRSKLGAHRLHGGEGLAAGDDHALAAARADHAVGGDGELERDVRPPLGDPLDVAGMGARRLLGEHAGGDRDAGRLEHRMALAGVRGSGSTMAVTTRATLAATSASLHGFTRPLWAQGSSVT